MAIASAALRVVELGDGLSAAYAGRLLADMGSEVIKVELRSADDGDETEVASTAAVLDAYLNSGKKRVTRGRGIASEELLPLFHSADVALIEHARGETPDLDAARLSRRFPHLVAVSITPFGLTGNLMRTPAEDLTLQALGGISIGIGSPGRPPLKLPGDQSGYQAGVTAAIAALAGVLEDRGALFDLAKVDVWAGIYSGVEVANAHFGREKKGRAGHRVYRAPYPRTILPCKDGYFAIQCTSRAHWQTLLKMVDREDLANDPLFVDRVAANDQNGDAADSKFLPWFAERTKEQILELCVKYRIPGAPVYSISEVLEHPHLKSRGYFTKIEHGGKSLKVPGPLVNQSRREGKPPPEPVLDLPEHASRGFSGERGAGRRRTGSTSDEKPLSGIRVVDFGWVWAGAVPGHLLADLGAQVIKIESMKRLDYMRQGRPIVGSEKDPEQNPMFQNVNRGKLSFRVNMTTPKGAELLRALVAKSDVVIENFTPGTLAKYGLGWDQLQRVQPGLIMCSMSAVGQAGPLRDIRTYATMIASLAGLDSLVGYPGERVLGSQSSYADPNASLHATYAVLAALHRRRGTGKGEYIDLSQWEAAVNLMAEVIVEFEVDGRDSCPSGTRSLHCAPYGNYPAKGEDSWIAIAVQGQSQWEALLVELDRPDWSHDERFKTFEARRDNAESLDRCLASETIEYDARELATRLSESGVAAAPLLTPAELPKHDYFRERALFQSVTHPILGELPVYGLPWKRDGEVLTVERRAPLLGEDNDWVLSEVLGLTDDELNELRGSDVLD